MIPAIAPQHVELHALIPRPLLMHAGLDQRGLHELLFWRPEGAAFENRAQQIVFLLNGGQVNFFNSSLDRKIREGLVAIDVFHSRT